MSDDFFDNMAEFEALKFVDKDVNEITENANIDVQTSIGSETSAIKQHTEALKADLKAQQLLNTEKQKGGSVSDNISERIKKHKQTLGDLSSNLNFKFAEDVALKKYAATNYGKVVYSIPGEKNHFYSNETDALNNVITSKKKNSSKEGVLNVHTIPEDVGDLYFDLNAIYSKEYLASKFEKFSVKDWIPKLGRISEKGIKGEDILKKLTKKGISEKDFVEYLYLQGVKGGNLSNPEYRVYNNISDKLVSKLYDLRDINNVRQYDSRDVHSVIKEITHDVFTNGLPIVKSDLVSPSEFSSKLALQNAHTNKPKSPFSQNTVAWRQFPYDDYGEITRKFSDIKEGFFITNGIDIVKNATGKEDSTSIDFTHLLKTVLEMYKKDPNREVFAMHNHPYKNDLTYASTCVGKLPSLADDKTFSVLGGLVSSAIYTNNSGSMRVFSENPHNSNARGLFVSDNGGIRWANEGIEQASDEIFYTIDEILNNEKLLTKIADDLREKRVRLNKGLEPIDYSRRLHSDFANTDPETGLSAYQQKFVFDMWPNFTSSSGKSLELVGSRLEKYIKFFDVIGSPEYARGFMNIIESFSKLEKVSDIYNFGHMKRTPEELLSEFTKKYPSVVNIGNGEAKYFSNNISDYVDAILTSRDSEGLGNKKLSSITNIINKLESDKSKLLELTRSNNDKVTEEVLKQNGLTGYIESYSKKDNSLLLHPNTPSGTGISDFKNTGQFRNKELGTVFDVSYKDPSKLLRDIETSLSAFKDMVNDLTRDINGKVSKLTPSISVHDMVLTNDGRLIETDPRDTLIALRDPSLSLSASQQIITDEQSGRTGIISKEELEILKNAIYTIQHFEKMLKDPTTSASYNNAVSVKNDIMSGAFAAYNFAMLPGGGFGQTMNIFGQNAPLAPVTGNAADLNSFFDSKIQAQEALRGKHENIISSLNEEEKVFEEMNRLFDKIDKFEDSSALTKISAMSGLMTEIDNFLQKTASMSSMDGARNSLTQYESKLESRYQNAFGDSNVLDILTSPNNKPGESFYAKGDIMSGSSKTRNLELAMRYAQSEILREQENTARIRAKDEAIRYDTKNKGYLFGGSERSATGYLDSLGKDYFNNDSQLRTLSVLLGQFESLGKYFNRLPEDALQTAGQRKLSSDYNAIHTSLFGKEIIGENGERINDGSGLITQLSNQRKDLFSLVNNISGTDNITEKNKGIDQLRTDSEQFTKSLDDVIKMLLNAVKQTDADIKNDKNLQRTASEQVPDIHKGKKRYDYYKYALIRNADQQNEYNAYNDQLPMQFSTTGNLKDSFLKTIFNKSVGYRQRQGLTGFLANVGYNDSGTLASIGLGAFASALTKASKVVLNFASESTKAFGEIESIRTNLGIVYGSQAEADSTFSEIAQYSVKSPFGVQTVSEYAVLLKQSGIYASDLMDTLKQIGDVAGGNQQKFENIANAFSQIEANGKATTRQLRQLATAGIPIYKELAKETGKSVENVRKMTEQGKITSDIIETVFQNMTGAGGMFENAVEIGAKTWKARQQNLADAKQLAQAEFGKTIINAFGSGQDDSLAQILLEFKESFYESVKYLSELHNIKKSVSNIEKQEGELKTLQSLYDSMKAENASPEALQIIKDRITKLSGYYTPEQQRATAEALLNAMRDKYHVTNELDDTTIIKHDEYAKLEHLVNELSLYTNENGTRFFKNESFTLDSPDGESEIDEATYKRLQKEQLEAQVKLQTVTSETLLETFYKKIGTDNLQKAYTSIANKSFSSGFEELDKAMNKNSKGLYTFYQKGEQAFEGTSLGKEAKQKRDIKEWNDIIGLYDKVRPFFDEQGRIVDTFNGTIEELTEAIKTGILQPLENIATKPELLAKDYTYNLSVNDKKRAAQIEARNANWNTILDNVRNLNTLKQASDISLEASKAITQFQNSVLGLSNTKEGIAIFNKQILILKNTLEQTGNESILPFIEQLTTVKAITPKLKNYWDANGDPVDPLWRRVESSKLGLDIGLMRRTDMSSLTGLSLGLNGMQRQSASSVLKSYIQSYGQTGRFISQRGIVNPYDGGTTAVDWNKTSKALNRFALSLESAISVTKSFASSVETELSTLTEFYTAAFSTGEEQQNIYDEKYRDLLGPLFNTLGATEVQGFSLLDENGHLRQETMKLVESIIEQKSTLLMTTNTLLGFKEALKSAAESAQQAKMSFAVISGEYSNTALRGLSSDKQMEALRNINSIWNSNELLQSKMSLEDFQNAVLRGMDIGKLLSVVVPESLGSTVVANLEDTSADSLRLKEIEDTLKITDITKNGIEKFGADNESFIKNLVQSKIQSQFGNILDARDALNDKDLYNTLFEDTVLEEYFKNLYSDANKRKEFSGNALQYKDIYDKEYLAKQEEFAKSQKEKYKEELKLYSEREDLQKSLADKNAYNNRENTIINEENVNIAIRNKQIKDATDTNEAADNISQILIKLFDDIRSVFATEKASDFYNTLASGLRTELKDMYSEGINGPKINEKIYSTYGYSEEDALAWLVGPKTQVTYGNTYRQQRALDALGFKDKTMKQVMREGFMDKNGIMFGGKEQQENEKAIVSAYADLKGFNADNILKDLRMSPVDVRSSRIQEMIEQLGEAKDKTEIFNDAMEELGDTLSNTLSQAILDGWNNSWKSIGSTIAKTVRDTRDLDSFGDSLSDGAKDLAMQWKNVGQSILDTLGPTMAQVGLQLLPTNPTAAVALIAASGVAGVLSGILSQVNDNKDDQTSKLQALKDLLSQIIDQAKTDADYYQKNILHENALSEGYKISSVHDAVISSHGNIITTDPKDFLIATKNPGSLGGSGDVKVNFNFIDKSTGGKVQVQSTSQRRNADGSIDIEAVVVATMNKALANGDLDPGMAAMNRRINGVSYAG